MVTSKMVDTLPSLPSALLTLALDDLTSVLRQPDRFEVNMEVWHGKGRSGRSKLCQVCFAGSVMACSLGLPDRTFIRRGIGLEMCESETLIGKFIALDEFRSGNVHMCLATLGFDCDPDLIPEYMEEAPLRAKTLRDRDIFRMWLEEARAVVVKIKDAGL